MKKNSLLLATCLIITLALLLVSCTKQESKSIVGEPETNTSEPPAQSQYMPLVNSIDTKSDIQTYPDPISIEQNTNPSATSGEAPAKAVSQDNTTIDIPYVRSPGAQGQTLSPEKWQEWPVLPVISENALEIYRRGIEQGRDPTHFSKVGDCQNIHQYFLGLLDDPTTFRLGANYEYLQETIDYFSGSWSRHSEAVRTGFNVASVLAPIHADLENCQPGETPLVCEIRIWNPSIAIISMEKWPTEQPVEAYENYLRQIVEYTISQNVLPIVATKADNMEGNHAINLSVAKVAAEYDIPMWNFWAATDPLTDHGLMEDGFHLTNGPNYYDDPVSLDLGWPVRNLTGLLAIDTVWKSVR